MRKNTFTILLIAILAIASKFALAQTKPITQETIKLNGEKISVAVTELNGTEKEIVSAFNKYLKKYKTKLKLYEGNYQSKPVLLADIINKQGVIVTEIKNQEGVSIIKVGFRLGKDTSLSAEKYPVEMPKFVAFVQSFCYNFQEKYTKKEISINKTEIKNTQQETRELKRDIHRFEKEIKRNTKSGEKVNNQTLNESIENAKGMIETNRLRLKRLKNEQKETVKQNKKYNDLNKQK